LKRFLDLFISSISIIILFFPFLILIALIKITSSGPVFYFSKRVGLNSKEFLMPKFRTMKVTTPLVETNKLVDANLYITNIGKFLRKYSIDELPQLFLVLIGTMTIVGPRPALFNQYELIEKRKNLGIDKIKPGITGLAQISGRDLMELDTKIFYDYEYLKKKNFFFDIKIILKTILIVIKQKGILH
jgi:O-antigen biosynthesis protein WbqP